MAFQAAHAASARISLRQSEIDQLGGTRHLKIRFRQLPISDKGSSPIRVSPNERDGLGFAALRSMKRLSMPSEFCHHLLRPPLVSFCLICSSMGVRPNKTLITRLTSKPASCYLPAQDSAGEKVSTASRDTSNETHSWRAARRYREMRLELSGSLRFGE
jgi:hypothetical protein